MPWSGEFLLNTTTSGNQNSPALSTLADGRSVAVWTDDGGSGGDASATAVRGQIFNANGSKSGAEFLVNTTVAAAQGDAKATALGNGGFVVVWTDGSQSGADTSGDAIRGQIFNADGSKLGAEFLVNSTTAAGQHDPDIATLADGRFAVTWADQSGTGGDTSGSAIRGQLFNTDGSRSGGEFLVNTSTANDQAAPSIAGLGNGRFVAAWVDRTQTDTTSMSILGNVMGQIFNADGTQFGGEFRINSHNTTIITASGPRFSGVIDPSVAVLDDGRFAVAWAGFGTGRGFGVGMLPVLFGMQEVVARIFGPDGSALGNDIVPYARSDQFPSDLLAASSHVDVTAAPGGRFALTWVTGEGPDPSGDLVAGQLFNADGSGSGSAFQVNTTTAGNQFQNAMSTLADGRFLVAWTDSSMSPDDPSGNAVRAQIFDPRESGVTLVGNGFANQFYGTPFSDLLDGAAAADLLVGAGGDDSYFVDDPADMIVENPGGGTDTVRADLAFYQMAANVEIGVVWRASGATLQGHDAGVILFGNAGPDTLIGGGGNDQFAGGSGNDTINGLGGADAMGGGPGDDVYIVDAGDAVFENAGEGTDTAITVQSGYQLAGNVENGTVGLLGGGSLLGNDLSNLLSGNSGNDQLNGGGGPDIMAGGFGDDTFYVEHLGDQVIEVAGQGGADHVVSLVNDYVLPNEVENGTLGLPGGGTLTGNGLVNSLFGGAGADTLDGAGGADTLNGGAGDDSYRVDDSGDLVVENPGGGTDTVRADLALYQMAANVEIGVLLRASGATLQGHDGGVILFGGAGADTLLGGAGNDQFAGGLGNDTIIGLGGADAMGGGAGDDVYIIDAADAVFENAGEGTDTVISVAASHQLASNVENGTVGLLTGATLTGNDLANLLIGNSGNDLLNGGGGADTMSGGFGDDTFYVEHLGDQVIEVAGQGGADHVVTLVSGYVLAAEVENGTLAAAGGGTLTGNALGNSLSGGAFNDALDGGLGADWLVGNGGINTLIGGAGADRFVFTFGQGATDTAADFDGAAGDVFDLRNTAAAGVNDFDDLSSRMSQNGSDVLISLGPADQIRVENALVAVLQAHPEYFMLA
jgi:Ca2+-binding RTX toxin-like protein